MDDVVVVVAPGSWIQNRGRGRGRGTAIDGDRPSQFPRQISPSVRPSDQETSAALISFRRDSKGGRDESGRYGGTPFPLSA